ncbi:MAG TPA: hypothetical protein VGY48_34850 [Vicinamibacterales bacterium]|jgi:hypothetical protein|nr:hypothetical protein [Vicinamibacterales bacterium]HWW86496.1 hypothetical protein [Vicinamibacterales bacterium]
MEPLVRDAEITPSSTAVDGDAARTDRLFMALDGIRIDDPAGGWITEVLGIHTIRGEWWVQIAAVGNGRRSVLLHFSGSVTTDDAIQTLRLSLVPGLHSPAFA